MAIKIQLIRAGFGFFIVCHTEFDCFKPNGCQMGEICWDKQPIQDMVVLALLIIIIIHIMKMVKLIRFGSFIRSLINWF